MTKLTVGKIEQLTDAPSVRFINPTALVFTIYGKIPAKSSSRRIVRARNGRTFIISSAQCKQFERDFHVQALKIEKNIFADKRLSVNIIWYADSYRQDIDSPAKVIFDCLQKEGIILNDNKIDKYTIERFISKDNPRAEIRITEDR